MGIFQKLRDFRYALDTADRQSSCTGKMGWDRMGAEAAAVRMRDKTGQLFDAYPCRHCEHWHIGHARGAGRRVIIRFDANVDEARRSRGEDAEAEARP